MSKLLVPKYLSCPRTCPIFAPKHLNCLLNCTPEGPFTRSIEQTRDGITFEQHPISLPKALAFHCFVSLGKGDLFLAGGFEVSAIIEEFVSLALFGKNC